MQKNERKTLKRKEMEKIVFEGQTYYVDKGDVYDQTFMQVPDVLGEKVLKSYFATIDYTLLEERDLLKHVVYLKKAKLYITCIEAIDYGLNTFTASREFYTSVFPSLCSCYRAMGKPEKAISFWMENRAIFSCCLSSPLLTSLAAAWCDLGQYDKALKCANRAYAMQGGTKNYITELSKVYARIKKETGEKYN